ncbi:MAG: DUF1501 domain-containing protein [Gemmataceae bacterium]
MTAAADKDALELLGKVNRDRANAARRFRLDARIESYELAAKMQQHAPEALDFSKETAAIRKAYGLEDKATEEFGRRCLLARRLLERGTRFVPGWRWRPGGPSDNWDNHGDIPKELPPIARSVDQPTAALLADLHNTGLSKDTLVVFSTEFGRQPFTQGATRPRPQSGYVSSVARQGGHQGWRGTRREAIPLEPS